MNEIIIVGLGNPGPRYELTRHNLGFLVVDFFNEAFLKDDWKKKKKGLLAEGVIEGRNVVLFKPQTFMNNSGEAVYLVMKGKSKENLLVVHDDLDMEFGKVKLKFDGSDGGHRGVRSIIRYLSSRDFWRLKMGIGREGDVVDYVLSRFSEDQFALLDDFIKFGAEIIYSFVTKGPERTMSLYNGKNTLLNS